MQKAQVFLTEKQKAALKAISASTGRKQSEIIRHGVDLAIAEAQEKASDWKDGLCAVKGIWRHRRDIDEVIERNRARWRKRHASLTE